MRHLSIFVCMIFCIMSLAAQKGMGRAVIPFDREWKFALGEHKGAQTLRYNDSRWRTLDLPHDWSIEGENREAAPGGGNVGYFTTGTGWYRKKFDIKEWNVDRLYSIEFDGVYENSEVWINGHNLGKRPGGYVSFAYDITPYVKPAGNVVAVYVDNSRQPNSRWYSGSGIYRHVRLVETGKVHIERYGVFVHTKEIRDSKATMAVKVSIANAKREAHTVVLKNVLRTREGKVVASSESVVSIPSGQAVAEQELVVNVPELWSLESPYLYTLTSSIHDNEKEIDMETTTTGIRTLEYSIDKGFLLNGNRIKMKGVNLHHDGGAVGAAVPERVWERRLEILKSGGCNAIRTAHNPPAPEFLDICDRLGFLVMDEAFDEWLAGKRDYTYKLYFAQWHEADLKTMIMRDRNHPSVVMWSIGNEIPDQSSKEGPSLARKMIALCHELDPTRLVTTGNDNIAADKNAATEEFLAEFANDIVGYNYPDRYRDRREMLYSIDKARFPNRRIVGTETGGVGGSRGASQMRPLRMRPGSLTSQLIDVEQRWKFTLLNDYVAGDFMWTGIDYYGETFWPSRGAQSGYLDNCGFKKDGYYFFKSIWTDEPMVHLAANWNREGQEGKIVQVVCFTNCGEVELFVNGKSYGVKTFEFPRKGNAGEWNTYPPGKVFTSTADLHLAWDVLYEQGEIKAVAKKDGKEYICRQVTAGAPAGIRLTLDRNSIGAVPSDVVHAIVEVLDRDGNLVPYSDNEIVFDAGTAEIIGVESGNMGDLSSPKSNRRKAYGGLCMAIIRTPRAGTFTVKASAEGLGISEQTFTAE